ncbi:MAG: dihydrodipicolinate synthase family protein [Pseudomonadota bacterium]
MARLQIGKVMRDFSTDHLYGIHAILYALFDADERLDRAAMRRQVQHCVAVGVHGMAALGLATEVAKLTEAERRMVMDWVAEDTAGAVPLAITIFGASVAEQVAQVKHAESVGADWVILQPPMVGSYGAGEYIRFFGRVAEATTLPVAIQNAPAFMGRGLSAAEIADLVRQHPNIRAIKGEGAVTDIAGVIAATGGTLPVFNGRAGLEMLDNFRIGCRGLILAPDCIDYAVAAYEAFRLGDAAKAEASYAQMLPAVVATMQGLEHLICYGKRLYAARTGQDIHDRAPAMRPNQTGIEMVARLSDSLGPLQQR